MCYSVSSVVWFTLTAQTAADAVRYVVFILIHRSNINKKYDLWLWSCELFIEADVDLPVHTIKENFSLILTQHAARDSWLSACALDVYALKTVYVQTLAIWQNTLAKKANFTV